LHLYYDYLYALRQACFAAAASGRSHTGAHGPGVPPAIFFLDPNFPFDLVTRIFYNSIFSTAA
jgi:hypothetical protein